MGSSKLSFRMIRERIRAYEGEVFTQIRGGEFKYRVTESAIIPDRTNQNIPKKHFEQATQSLPLVGTAEVQHLRGPSYIYAILMDRRIRQNDW